MRKKDRRGLSFLNRVRVSYGIMIAIPIIILESFVIGSSMNFIREQQTIQAKETIERNYQDIENQMAICQRSLMYLISNGTLKDFLATTDEQYKERVTAANGVSTLLYNTLLSNQYFTKIEVYSDKHFAVVNAIFKDIDEYEDIDWYDASMETTETLWWYEDGKYVMTRRILSNLPEKKLGVIRIELKKDIFDNSSSMFADIPIDMKVVSDSIIVYEFQNERNTEAYGYQEERALQEAGWKVVYSVNKSYFSSINHPQIIWSFVIVLVLLLMGLWGINFSTQKLLKNLYRVMDDVKKVKEDNFEIQVDESSNDEIGDLARCINQMLYKIQMLIDEVYESKIEQKNLELNLLQSKINPHFLYNNLSAINWIAIENGEDRIYEITTKLATFYRTALNKGVNTDKLSVEINNIKAYISLQLMSHEDSFEVEYEIDETLIEINIPIFVMQPLVENAIEHGIDTLREKKGKIIIRIFEEANNIIIQIQDNGEELFNRIGTSVMNVSEYGYGVSNVNRRIQLLCGENYGVKISADQNGTTSTICIRADFIALDKKS